MGYVDLETGEIRGVKKDSLSYYHELGHLEFGKTDRGKDVRFSEQMTKDFLWLFLLVFLWIPDFLVKVGLSIWILRWLYYYYYEEVWCWVYAFKIKKRIKKSGSETV